MHVVIFDDGCGHITTIAKHFDKKARYCKDAVGKIHQIITGHVLTFDSQTFSHDLTIESEPVEDAAPENDAIPPPPPPPTLFFGKG